MFAFAASSRSACVQREARSNDDLDDCGDDARAADGCEVTTLGTLLEEPLQKNGDSWTVSVGVKPNHEQDWQLGLLLTVKDDLRATPVMNVTLNHESDFRVIRLHGHIGREEITGDDLPSMPRDLSFRIHVTVSRYELELQMGNVEKAATHGLEKFAEITTSTLAIRNAEAAEGFSVSHGCVEDSGRSTTEMQKYAVQPRFTGPATTVKNPAPPSPGHKAAVIAVASCSVLILIMVAIFLMSKRLRDRSPANDLCNGPPAIFYVVQSPERSQCSLLRIQQESVVGNSQPCENVEDPATCENGGSNGVFVPSRSPRPEPPSSVCRNTIGREVVAGHVVSERPGQPLSKTISNHVYESITDLEASDDEHSSSNSTYEPFCA
ncbi:hypothetical protein C7M84_020698 [Penaeus vannamei]|uniref:Uncharacterized protein n=1 Tax=Penaeus vannamei TaxID=6689 RepID=A0A3R7NEQ3_PENVA|nr:hypothetical protein C7M84_020698 [Penaeus vannamei]